MIGFINQMLYNGCRTRKKQETFLVQKATNATRIRLADCTFQKCISGCKKSQSPLHPLSGWVVDMRDNLYWVLHYSCKQRLKTYQHNQ